MSLLKYTDIAKIFEEIEFRLIANLKRNLARHKQEEQKEGFNWSAWQAEKLKSFDSFRKQNKTVMSEYSDIIDEQTRQLMSEQFAEGEALDGERTGEPKTENFFGVNESKMNSLIEDITSIEKTVETAAVRNMDDVYRQTVNRVQLAMASGEMTLNQAIDTATRDFLSVGINSIIYSDGRRINIADYVRMALRTTSNRATLQGRAKAFNELGYDTVLISQYGGCSKTCEPWQGKPYIDDVFTEWHGENDGNTGISNYCGEQFPLLSAAIRGGLFHPNCRHTMSLYIHGQTKIPKPIPEDKIKKQRELEQHQRYLERKIRKYKRLEIGTIDPEQAKLYTQQRKKVQKELSEFIKANDDVLKRDYFREKVYSGVGLTNERREWYN
ncbi:MAG: phage minor capsid protein [Ruminococcus sp.]|nr:phage minor capsid protein [Ruminococcus sp.]